MTTEIGHLPPALVRRALQRSSKVAVAVGAVALFSLLAGCKAEDAPVAKPVPVRVVVATPEPLEQVRRYVGTVRPRYEADLGFRVGGKIVARLVNIGDRIESGTPIARLDSTDYRLNLEAQEAEVAAARSTRDQAIAAEQRYRLLHRDGHVSQAALDQRVATADEARSRVERAERNLELQQNQLAYTVLVADRAGVVSQVMAEKGQVVVAGQSIVRLADLSELEAVVALPEQQLPSLSDIRASVELWSLPGRRYEARLRELSPEADRAARTFDARFTIVGADGDVVLGRTANVTVAPMSSRPVVPLPLTAITSTGKGAFVWVVRPDGATIERRPVETVAYGADRAFVAEGLKPGDKVVALGVHLLDEASAVRIVEVHAGTAPGVRH